MMHPFSSPRSIPLFSLRRWAARLVAISTLGLAFGAAQAQVGMQRVPLKNGPDTADTQALMWYPSPATASAQRFGPFEVAVAPGAPVAQGQFPLVLLSHGTGGHEMGHAWLARLLAEQGFLVLSLRHPGDNYQDRSGIGRPDYLAERPRQLSRALDALLADDNWAPRIDAARITAVGHSAGGHTVLALAGGQPDRARLMRHCSSEGQGLAEDAALCTLAGFSSAQPASPLPEGSPSLPSVTDTRIRAVVAAEALGQGLNLQALASDLRVPVLIEASRKDEVLAHRFHGGALCAAVGEAHCHVDEAAGHYALFQAGTGPLGAPGLDPAWNPAGFDRAAWQAQAGMRILRFLQAQVR